MIYLSKNYNFEYFLCNADEEKNCKIIIPNDFNNKSIAAKSFFCDKSVTTVSVPIELKSIESSAFENCENLKTFHFGELGNNTDFSTSKLYGIKLDRYDNELSINYKCFYNCSNLETVIFPFCKNFVLEKNSFSNCFSLRTVLIASDNCCIHPETFTGCSENLTFLLTQSNENAKSFARENGFRYVEL